MTELEQGTQEPDAGRVAAAYACVHPADVLHQPRRRCIRAVVAPVRPQTLRNRRRIRPRPRIKVVLPTRAPMSVKRTPMSVSNVRRVGCSTVSQASAFSKRVSDFNVESHPSIQDLSKRSCHLVDAFGPLACLASQDVLRLRLVQALQRLHAVEALPHPLQRVGAASAGLLLVEVPRAGEHSVELTVHLPSPTAQQPVRELSLREASH